MKRREKMVAKHKNNKKGTTTARVIDIDKAREERRSKRVIAESKKKKRQRVTPAAGASHRRSTQALRKRSIYLIIAVILFVIIGVSVYNLVSLKMEQAKVNEDYAALIKEKAQLKEELSNVDSDEYVEQKAREELKMILPGETLYIISHGEKDENNN